MEQNVMAWKFFIFSFFSKKMETKRIVLLHVYGPVSFSLTPPPGAREWGGLASIGAAGSCRDHNFTEFDRPPPPPALAPSPMSRLEGGLKTVRPA